MFSEEQERELAPLRELTILTDNDVDTTSDGRDANEQIRELRAKLVPVFLPFVEQLVHAGLITVSVNVSEGFSGPRADEYESVFGEPSIVFENGNIWIEGTFDGGSLKG